MTNRRYPIHAATLLARLGGAHSEIKVLALDPIPGSAPPPDGADGIATEGSGPGPLACVEVAAESMPGPVPGTVLVDRYALPLDALRLLELALSDEPGFSLRRPADPPST